MIKLSNRPPYVTPNRYPNEIIADYFTYDEKEKFEMIISTKQKSGAEWESIRAKLPEQFLFKVKKIINECWENGFCNPRIREGKLVWYQIMGSEFGRKYQEQCDLCRNTFSSGQCKGRLSLKNNNKNFKKCWEK